MSSKTREAFEKWAVNGGLHVEHVANIDFFYPGAFGIWQAAEAAALERAAHVLKQRCDRLIASGDNDQALGEALICQRIVEGLEREGDKS